MMESCRGVPYGGRVTGESKTRRTAIRGIGRNDSFEDEAFVSDGKGTRGEDSDRDDEDC